MFRHTCEIAPEFKLHVVVVVVNFIVGRLKLMVGKFFAFLSCRCSCSLCSQAVDFLGVISGTMNMCLITDFTLAWRFEYLQTRGLSLSC